MQAMQVLRQNGIPLEDVLDSAESLLHRFLSKRRMPGGTEPTLVGLSVQMHHLLRLRYPSVRRQASFRLVTKICTSQFSLFYP